MPRYTVHVRGEWLAVPCLDAQLTVGWLGREAVRRYIKNKPDNGGFASVGDVRFLVRRCKGLGLLDNEDLLEVALEDNEFVEVVIEGDTMSPDFIPSQPEGVYLYSKYREPEKYIALDGDSLTTEDLVGLGKGHYKIKLTPTAEKKVQKSREVIDSIVKEKTVVYGITTGFGKFARTVIPTSKLEELQFNLVRSHSSASCLPYIPEKGTVGASGDLAPLSHLALGLIGEGKMWSPKSGWADAKYVLEAHGLKPVVLKPKEGLALINGTQMITSLGCEAVERASAIARQADIVAALTLEVLKGTTKAFDTDIHAVRPHRGQIEVAFRFRSLLDSDHHPSEIAESHRFCDRVQDAYTLRCCPQALDYLAIGVHELAAISERRIERLCNPSLSELPAFLVAEGGLNSGFMIAHCTAAALVLAIELLAACQGIEFLRPLKTTTPLEKVYDLVRSVVRPWIKDRFMAPDIEAAHRLLVEQKVWEVAAPYIEKYRIEHIPESRPVSPTAFSLEFLQRKSTKIPESEDL
ncbi:histidine ammonia-lyase [Camelus ferus]|nr:histidine ammonia-lyase [Camelus ferus]